MSGTIVGIVDYGIGNHASVVTSLRSLDFRVTTSSDAKILDGADVLLLPGVGAFSAAMAALAGRKLDGYLREQAAAGRPILGICLGMQLLAGASYEHEYTKGLDLIPGEIVPFENGGWHIGWNRLDCDPTVPLIQTGHQRSFYFNHSFHYRGEASFIAATANGDKPIEAVIHRDNVVGLQFHPEKSQSAGRILLHNLIKGMA